MSKTEQGAAFEKRVAKMFEDKGFSNIKLTPPSNDGGIDISMYKGVEKCGVECKDHETPIGRPVIQKFHSALLMNNMKHGYVVVSSTFSQQAIGYVNSINNRQTDLHIELINGKKLELYEREIIEAKRIEEEKKINEAKRIEEKRTINKDIRTANERRIREESRLRKIRKINEAVRIKEERKINEINKTKAQKANEILKIDEERGIEEERTINKDIRTANERRINEVTFEKRVVKIFEDRGFINIRPIPLPNDGGIDISMYKGVKKCGVKCKDHEMPTERLVIQKFHSALLRNEMKYGCVVVSNTFSQQAISYVDWINHKQRYRYIELIDGKKLELYEREIIKAKKIEEERKINEPKRIQEQKINELHKSNKLNNINIPKMNQDQKIEEKNRIDEGRRVREESRLKEIRKINEAIRIKEERRINNVRRKNGAHIIGESSKDLAQNEFTWKVVVLICCVVFGIYVLISSS